MFIISITNMINMIKNFNSKKFLVLVRYRLLEIIDTQVARRGRQYHSQPSYKRQKLVPTPHPTRAGEKKQKLLAHPPKTNNKKQTVKKKQNKKKKKKMNKKIKRKQLTALFAMTAIPSSLM